MTTTLQAIEDWYAEERRARLAAQQETTLNDIEKWERELLANGWQKVRWNIWRAPSGGLFRGPYLAFKTMRGEELYDEREASRKHYE